MDAGKLTPAECDALDADIERLRSSPDLQPRDAELMLGRVLEPLLRSKGFDLEHTGGVGDAGIDFRATRQTAVGTLMEAETVGIKAKFLEKKRLVPMSYFRALIGAALLRDFNRFILVSNGEFSQQAQAGVAHSLPLKIELLGLKDLTTGCRVFASKRPTSKPRSASFFAMSVESWLA